MSFVLFLYRQWSCCPQGEAAIWWLGSIAQWSPGIQNWGAPVGVDGGCPGGGKQVLWIFFFMSLDGCPFPSRTSLSVLLNERVTVKVTAAIGQVSST